MGWIFEAFCIIAGGYSTRVMLRPSRVTGDRTALAENEVTEIWQRERTPFYGWMIVSLGSFSNCMTQTKTSLSMYAAERGLTDRGLRTFGKLGIIERVTTWHSKRKSLLEESMERITSVHNIYMRIYDYTANEACHSFNDTS